MTSGMIGLFFISTIAASIGYLVSSFIWRWWVGRKRRGKAEKLRMMRESLE